MAKTISEIVLKYIDTSDFTYGPNTYEFFTSTDGISWTSVASRTGETWTASYEEKVHTLSTPILAKHIGLDITVNNGQVAVGIGEMFIYGY